METARALLVSVILAAGLLFGCRPPNSSSQDTNWRYTTAYVEGFEHQLNYRAAPISDSLMQTCDDTGRVRLCVYPEPQRYFVPPPTGQVFLKAALVNASPDTVQLYYLGGLAELRTEIWKDGEWVNFQRQYGKEGHLEYVPVCPRCFVNVAVQLKVSGTRQVRYRLRLVTTTSVVFSNEIMVNCSKAQYEQAGIPFPNE